ncbi:hypothetical protein OC846_004655 [Tilletia horrida]|uniref:Uncharacterized protein n=1 Tax=Tilletia horrida TaxID=155126 RepID=A0AAN6GM77_9BASI|nr:hypothetical protein OC845_005673 [Tilletia horrida]KAK0547968.1 hypothetical protein OC846_004655 [Tilletia horrida]KAK0561727.1 hypothetical protein OC861_005670 [Tilletia horrida]
MKLSISALLLLSFSAALGAPAPVDKIASLNLRSSSPSPIDSPVNTLDTLDKRNGHKLEMAKGDDHPANHPVILLLTSYGPRAFNPQEVESHLSTRAESHDLSRRHVDAFLGVMKGIWDLMFPLNEMVHIPQFDELEKQQKEEDQKPSETPNDQYFTS